MKNNNILMFFIFCFILILIFIPIIKADVVYSSSSELLINFFISASGDYQDRGYFIIFFGILAIIFGLVFNTKFIFKWLFALTFVFFLIMGIVMGMLYSTAYFFGFFYLILTSFILSSSFTILVFLFSRLGTFSQKINNLQEDFDGIMSRNKISLVIFLYLISIFSWWYLSSRYYKSMINRMYPFSKLTNFILININIIWITLMACLAIITIYFLKVSVFKRKRGIPKTN